MHPLCRQQRSRHNTAYPNPGYHGLWRNVCCSHPIPMGKYEADMWRETTSRVRGLCPRRRGKAVTSREAFVPLPIRKAPFCPGGPVAWPSIESLSGRPSPVVAFARRHWWSHGSTSVAHNRNITPTLQHVTGYRWYRVGKT